MPGAKGSFDRGDAPSLGSASAPRPANGLPGRRGAGGGRRAIGDGGDASVVASVGGATIDGGATMGDAIIDVGASIAGGASTGGG